MVRVLVPLAVLAVVPAAARGQDWPKPTPAGERARAELLATCARELALLVGRPPTSVADLALLGDAGAFRVALAARRDLPAPALRDALVGWRVSGQFPVAGLPLLDALGVESRDPVARGFAALIGGLWDASRGHSRAAAAGFESGAEFFPEGGRWGLWKPECWSL